MELSTGSFVSFGWETFKKRAWFFVGASVVVLIVYLAAGSFVEVIDHALDAEVKSEFGSYSTEVRQLSSNVWEMDRDFNIPLQIVAPEKYPAFSAFANRIDAIERQRLLRERVLAMREIWTKDEAEYHGELVDFDSRVTGCASLNQFEEALELLRKLGSMALRQGVEARRKFRAIELSELIEE